jgi:hypothetical protein
MISFEISGNNEWLITERKNTAPVKYDRGPLVNRSYVDEKNIYILRSGRVFIIEES